MSSSQKKHTRKVNISRKTSAAQVPQHNVLDLRSLIAKREIKQQRSERLEQPQTQSRKTSSKRRTKNSARTKRTVHRTKRTRPQPLKQITDRVESFIPDFSAPKKPAVKTSAAPRPRRKKRTKRQPLLERLPLSPEAKALIRPVAAFVIVALVLVSVPTVWSLQGKGSALEVKLTASAQAAFTHMQAAAQQLPAQDFTGAEESFALAQQEFSTTQQEINQLSPVIRALAPLIPVKGKTFRAGTHLVTAGSELALAGEQASRTIAELEQIDIEEVATDESTGLTSVMLVAHAGLQSSLEHLQTAEDALDEVDATAVPSEYRELVLQAQELLPQATQAVEEGVQLSELMLAFLGHNEHKRYLVLFANNREIRPCGGFPGSFGLFDIENGVVTQADVPGGGIYDIAGQTRGIIEPPEPLQLVTATWNVQDAGWFPHYPSCSQRTQHFLLDANDGLSVDGVISVSPDVVARMLEVTGPIDMTEEFDEIVSAENFYDIVQRTDNQEVNETDTPKQIITEMTPKLFDTLFSSAQNPDELLALLTLFQDSLNTKDILIHVNDNNVQQLLSARNWSGELMNTDGDYLHINRANIGGGKTSTVVENSANVETTIHDDGSITNRVTYTSVHNGDPASELSGVTNYAFVRFYIPHGSTVTSIDGFEQPDRSLFFTPSADAEQDAYLREITGEISINQDGVHTNTEYGKDVIGGWMITNSGESSRVVIEYTLPFALTVGGVFDRTDHYSLLFQKQPGTTMAVTQQLNLPEHWTIDYSATAAYDGSDQFALNEDYYLGVVLNTQ